MAGLDVQNAGRILRLVIPVSGVTLTPGGQFAVEKDFLVVPSTETPLPQVYAVFILSSRSETRIRAFLDVISVRH